MQSSLKRQKKFSYFARCYFVYSRQAFCGLTKTRGEKTKMAKSIRSKAKRKLRAAKREKIAAKERLKLLAIQEEEEGIKMIQDAVESSDMGENIPALSEDGDKNMDAVSEDQSVVKAKKKKPKKTSKSGSGKNVKRLKKKRKNKYKW